MAALGVAIAASACNAISGVDELVYDLDDAASGGHGGAPVTTSASTTSAAAGHGGAGGSLACGPCDMPPGPCFEATGSCVDGACSYAPLPMDTACSDDDLCTEGDVCDGTGTCVAGPECPNADPCADVICDDALGCVATMKTDGSSCGPLAADRCCGGVCVDVSSDANHCGGCGYACSGGQSCESVAASNQCSLNPADTTGRCTCDSTSRCPVGQICRTQTPHAWRCTPEGGGDCPGTTFVDVSFCPNYCRY